jgi:hypothetical protein
LKKMMLNKFSFPKSWGFKRTPIRPTELQVLNFAENYDYDTIWNDIIQISQKTILLIGPPLYAVASWMQEHCKFLDVYGNEMPWQYYEMDRVAHIRISTNEYHRKILLKTPYDEHVLYVDYPHRYFENQKVIVTISQNHPIEWLKQWIDYHHVVHNVDGLLLYNNRSTIYTTEELGNALNREDMTIKVLDYDVPFGVMGGGTWEWQGKKGTYLPWDSDFSQYVMLEHAKWKYLYCARLAINADTDELLIVKNSNLDGVADYCATGDHSVLLYDGIWIEPIDSQTGTLAKHVAFADRRFSNYWHTTGGDGRGIGVKWMLNPERNLTYQWHLHKTYGPHVKTKEITFGHFFAMNTSWSYQRDDFLGDYSRLEELSDLKQNLEQWTQGSRS